MASITVFLVGLAENGAAGHEGVGRLQLERRFPLRNTQEAYWTRHGYLSKSHLTIEKNQASKGLVCVHQRSMELGSHS